MHKFYKLFVLAFSLLVCYSSGAQSVLNPADTLVTYDKTHPPTQPTFGQIGKWVRTVRMSWNTSEYKAYIYKGCAFRLHYPKTYNPTANDGKKYPMIIMFHGLGEAGAITDNELQLLHGGQQHQAAVDNGVFDGYVLFMQSQGFWGTGQYQYLTEIINYMIANNKLDPYRVSANGLSAGGQGTWEMLFNHPTYIASEVPQSWSEIGYKDTSIINTVKFTPIWNFQGGLDGAPAPSTSEQVRDAMLAAGGNFLYTLFPTQGHDTWDSAYLEPDFFPFMNRAYMSNPWPLFGRTAFCPGDPINVTIGVVRGMKAYQWKKDSTVITGDTTNTIIATQAGAYYARVKRDTIWSDWSHTPVVISIKTPTITPPITVSGVMSDVIPASDGKNYVTLQVPNNGYISYVWKKVGKDSVMGTQRTLTVNQPGSYIVSVNEQFGCSSVFSPPFAVVNANGTNPPSAATNLVATPLSFTQIELDWARNPKPVNSETGFEIYRAGASSGPYTYIGEVPADTVTYIDTALTPNVKYYYAVRAVDSTAAAALSNQASATTQSDKTPPTPPDSLTVVSTTESSITLKWKASTDNVGVYRYDIYINGAKSYTTDTTSFIVSGLPAHQGFAFYVKARDISGNVSTQSNQVNAASIMTGLHYKYYEGSWSKLPDFSTLTPIKQGVAHDLTLTVANKTTNFGMLWEGYIYVPVTGSYKIETYSDDGSKLWLSTYNASSTPVANNDGAHGATYAGTTVTLTAGVYPISIAYFQGSGGDTLAAFWTNSTVFGTTTRQKIAPQYYTEGHTYGPVPAAPSTVAATATAYNKVNVSWTDNSTNETGFEIYRATSLAGKYSIVNTTAAGSTSFTDTTVAASTTYYYKVQAINNNGGSGYDPISVGLLNYSYYQGSWTKLPNFSTLTPVSTGTINNFLLTPTKVTTNYGFVYSGMINIPATGSYTFYTSSRDGSDLYINGMAASNLVVNNDGVHSATEKSGTITLSKGSYPIYVTFFHAATGTASLTVSYKGPTISKIAIPDTAFMNKNAIATTPTLPAAPGTPTSFLATASSSSIVNQTWNNVAAATSYQIYRSVGDATKYRPLATLPAGSTSYSDTSLFGNVNYYYKITCSNAGGTSGSAVDSARTKDNRPVIVKVAPRLNAQYNTTTTIPFSATDADGDALAFTIQNKPAFGTFVDNGNQTATLTLNPDSTMAGYYSNIKVVVSDNNGGYDSTTFNLVVNNHTNPTIDSIPNYTLNENDTLSIPLTGHEIGSSDSMSWTIINLPNSNTVTAVSNGVNTLFLHPTYAAAGTYNVQVSVSDTDGGYATRQFTITVNYKNPNTIVYTRFYGGDAGSAPWNTITGLTSTGFTDANGNSTTMGLTLNTWWYASYNGGPNTGSNSGVYPDFVLEDYYYFGIFGGPDTVNASVTGLDTTKLYNITFYAGSVWGGASDNGTTSFRVGNQTVSQEVQNNTQNTLTISDIKPDATGNISFTMGKVGATTPVGYLNALVITQLYDDGTTPLAPTSLNASLVSQGAQLSWTDVAYNATGYQVYRSTSATGTFSLVGTTSSNASSYIDTTVGGNTQYYYEVAAVNTHGSSPYSNMVSVTTADRIPKINPISTLVLKNNQSATISISAVDDPTDHITLSATNLPPFATLVDSGDGNGTIIVTPALGSTGYYQGIVVTATDNSDSSSSTSFDISVVDKDVTSVYLNFSDGTMANKPWNNLAAWPFAGTSFTNLLDDGNNNSGLTVTFTNGFQGVVASGMRPRNGHAIYSEAVMRPGEFEGTTTTDTIKVAGLTAGKKYNFVFFNSHDDGLNGLTYFTMGSQKVSLNATYNINKTVEINGIVPDASGNAYIAIAKDAKADYAFITSLIIESYDSSLNLLGPLGLTVTNTTRTTASMQWQDRSTSETGFEVWRANDSVSTYTLVKTLAAGTTSYTDTGLSPDRTYFYTVRAVNSTTALTSSYSNPVAATTLAYSVYVNFTLSNNAPAPWNNLDQVPQPGLTWSNFNDDLGNVSSVGMSLTDIWAGLYSAGMNPGNNSGVYPDTVLIDSYGLFPGGVGGFQVNNLDMAMQYNLTFFASSQAYGDVNTAYIVNSATALSNAPLLNTSLNTFGTLTVYGVQPDGDGNINVTVMPGTLTSQFGLIGTLVLQGYYPPASSNIPSTPGSRPSGAKQSLASSGITINSDGLVSAYPNPFTDHFTLSLANLQKGNNKVQVAVYDITGRMVYKNEYDDLNAGNNNIRIDANKNFDKPGIYLVKVFFKGTGTSSVMKLIKE
ncbi:MAG TPA: PA14 domain-containing protein [Flavipsychrobacter sp.]|nr:PA14 domain-containing protein [Flavipsychrobacter sp.]